MSYQIQNQTLVSINPATEEPVGSLEITPVASHGLIFKRSLRQGLRCSAGFSAVKWYNCAAWESSSRL